jgi:site-specific DNA recombinase
VCGEYARAQGWEMVERYSDAGISGYAQGNRPAFQRMRADAEAGGKFDVLIVMDTTRLCRSQELTPFINLLRFQGVRVVGVQDGFDSAAVVADMQAGLSGILSTEFRRMVRNRTHSALEMRARQRRPTGGKAYGYDSKGTVIAAEAEVVREIFERFGRGESIRKIAAALNARGVSSPGSTWNRTERRTAGWAGSGVRVIVRNEKYRGVVRWNCWQSDKNPITGQRTRKARPQSEWIVHTDERMRIVSDELWNRAQQRMKPDGSNGSTGAWRSGGRHPARYLLSGLLKCGTCGRNLIKVGRYEYGCGRERDGGAWGGVRATRRELEDAPLHQRLFARLESPVEVEKAAKELQAAYRSHIERQRRSATEAPAELQELTARIGRLRERLWQGDPDMTADEVQAAIDRAEAKRAELEARQPSAQWK